MKRSSVWAKMPASRTLPGMSSFTSNNRGGKMTAHTQQRKGTHHAHTLGGVHPPKVNHVRSAIPTQVALYVPGAVYDLM